MENKYVVLKWVTVRRDKKNDGWMVVDENGKFGFFTNTAIKDLTDMKLYKGQRLLVWVPAERDKTYYVNTHINGIYIVDFINTLKKMYLTKDKTVLVLPTNVKRFIMDMINKDIYFNRGVGCRYEADDMVTYFKTIVPSRLGVEKIELNAKLYAYLVSNF